MQNHKFRIHYINSEKFSKLASDLIIHNNRKLQKEENGQMAG